MPRMCRCAADRGGPSRARDRLPPDTREPERHVIELEMTAHQHTFAVRKSVSMNALSEEMTERCFGRKLLYVVEFWKSGVGCVEA